MKAWLNLRYTLSERVAVFKEGLERLGYEVMQGVTLTPEDGDILVSWNRIGHGGHAAREFESRGLPVLIAENAAWGNEFAGDHWYSLARRFHNTAGLFPIGGSERWDRLGVELAPWREGHEVVILPQRGIGPPEVAMPSWWPLKARQGTGGRIRAHPGKNPCKPLEDDLSDCRLAVTWGSGAAIKALMMGVPVQSDMPDWIGEQQNDDASRLAMFRRLAWATWRLDEIRSGEPFKRLLS